MKFMKIQLIFSGCLFLLALATGFSQQPQPAISGQASTFSDRLRTIQQSTGEQSTLTKFDLDFPGGPPKELVAAIQKASGRPLNAIVPDEFVDTNLPGLRMKNVNAPQLFEALTAASQKQEVVGSGSSYSWVTTRYGFRTEGAH